jgi:hypothetical protein
MDTDALKSAAGVAFLLVALTALFAGRGWIPWVVPLAGAALAYFLTERQHKEGGSP